MLTQTSTRTNTKETTGVCFSILFYLFIYLFLVFTWRHQILEFKTGGPTKSLPSFKERVPKNMPVHNFLARCRASFWK